MSDHDDTGACPACAAPVTAGDAFCESCGVTLDPVAAAVATAGPPGTGEPSGVDRPCPACGGGVAADGYCERCGARAASERDRWVEQPAPWVAAVCDRGLRHEHNEDALALAADADPGSFAALVVCDGVSSAPDSDVASLAAARAARDVLGAGPGGREVFVAAGPEPDTSPDGLDVVNLAPAGADDPVTAWGRALERAVAAAHEAATATALTLAGTGSGATRMGSNPPSCTFVAAVVDGPLVVTGCVGDSRAYWVPVAGPAVQLTTDDSWAAEEIARGVPRAEAEAGPHAHAITRWLGLDSPDPTPSVAHLTVESAGWLLVCSDGLWNYCSDPADLAAVLARAEQAAGPGPVALASELVAWANAQGGHDNISVALARLEPGPAPVVPN